MKNIAIIIDCWSHNYVLADDPPGSLPWNHDLMHRNIISLISVNQSIDTVILASHEISLDEFNSNTIWYTNFKKFNYSKAFTNPIVQHEMAGGIQHPDMPTTDCRGNTPLIKMKKCINRRTCICLLHYYWPDKFQIAAFHPYQLTLAGIENVYFFGEAWDICVMDRPLGYNWWIEFTDKNLFVYEKGITTHTTGIDKTIWLEQEEGLYQFDRNSNDEKTWC